MKKLIVCILVIFITVGCSSKITLKEAEIVALNKWEELSVRFKLDIKKYFYYRAKNTDANGYWTFVWESMDSGSKRKVIFIGVASKSEVGWSIVDRDSLNLPR